MALACHCDPIVAVCLPLELLSGKERFYFTPANLAKHFSLEEAVAQFEQSLIEEALRQSAGNKAQVAELLGVPVLTLKSKLKKYVQIDVNEAAEKVQAGNNFIPTLF